MLAFSRGQDTSEAIKSYAVIQLGLSGELINDIAPGLCFGLAAFALQCHAERQFEWFVRTLRALQSHPEQPSFDKRLFVESVLLFQVPTLQQPFNPSPGLPYQGLSRPSLLVSARKALVPVYVDMSVDVLIASMIRGVWQSVPGWVGLAVSNAQRSHAVALLLNQARQWQVIDSLARSPSTSLMVLLSDVLAIEPGEMMSVMLAVQSGYEGIVPSVLQRLAGLDVSGTVSLGVPWQRMRYGKIPGGPCPYVRKGHTEPCKEESSSKWHKVEGVLICSGCYISRLRQFSATAEHARCTFVRDGRQCIKTTSLQWHTDPLSGAKSAICHNCYEHYHTQLRADAEHRPCTQCGQIKSVKWHKDPVSRIKDSICDKCYQQSRARAGHLPCTRCEATSSCRWFTDPISKVKDSICNTCYNRHHQQETLQKEHAPCIFVSADGTECKNKFSPQWHTHTVLKIEDSICHNCYEYHLRQEIMRKEHAACGFVRPNGTVCTTKNSPKWCKNPVSGAENSICYACYQFSQRRRKKEAKSHSCPIPGCGKSFSSSRGLAMHKTRSHAPSSAGAARSTSPVHLAGAASTVAMAVADDPDFDSAGAARSTSPVPLAAAACAVAMGIADDPESDEEGEDITFESLELTQLTCIDCGREVIDGVLYCPRCR